MKITFPTINVKIIQVQRLAYFLTKNHIFDSKSIRDIYLMAMADPHPIHSYELEMDKNIELIDKEITAIRNAGIEMLFLGEKNFPKALENMEDGPVMLFVKSKSSMNTLFNHLNRHIAVIGTRDSDSYGDTITRQIVKSYINKPAVIVNGLTIGIGTVAHRTALENDIPTIAILPGPIDKIYPHCNIELAEEISEKDNCALISPFAPGCEITPVNFLIRNRIVAALCPETIIMQSKTKGGTIMTANMAASYGNKVFAVPGRLTDIRSEGCNRLIHSGIAEIYIP